MAQNWVLTAPFLPLAGHLFMALTVLLIHSIPVLVAFAGKDSGVVR